MEEILKFIIIVFVLGFVLYIYPIIYLNTQKVNKKTPTISTNTITYPSSVVCESCSKTIFPMRKNIDSSTWDLVCDCGEIAYKHPKREERKEQIKNLLD
jgi:hypothetical protein